MNYTNLTEEEVIALLDVIAYDVPADERIDLLVWDIINNNISDNTKMLAADIIVASGANAPDIAKAVAEWNLDFPPDETLFALIDELITPVVIAN